MRPASDFLIIQLSNSRTVAINFHQYEKNTCKIKKKCYNNGVGSYMTGWNSSVGRALHS